MSPNANNPHPSDCELSDDLGLLAEQLADDASHLADSYPPRLDANWVAARTCQAREAAGRPIRYWLVAASLSAAVLAIWAYREFGSRQNLALPPSHSVPETARSVATYIPSLNRVPAQFAVAEPGAANDVFLYTNHTSEADEFMELVSAPELEGLLDLLESTNEATPDLSL